MPAEVVVTRDGSTATVTLNRPRAINALSLRMHYLLRSALNHLATDPEIEAVQLRGAGERGFCAGADVRELRQSVLDGGDVTEFYVVEYGTDLLVAAFPKPITSHLAGIAMGAGLGLGGHLGDRVVGAGSVLAMPETRIGLFPDVFMSHRFARLPGGIGTHLALTGASVNAADALRLGLADRCEGPLPEPDPGLSGDWIDECYVGHDPVEIIGRLSEHRDPAARAAAAEITARSPLAIAVTLEVLRRSPGFATIADQYDQELALAVRMTSGPDFAEGVRAQLVDRDQDPHWTHSGVADVSRDEVLGYFEPLAGSAA